MRTYSLAFGKRKIIQPVLGWLFLAAAFQALGEQEKSPEIRFAVDGAVACFEVGAGSNLVNTVRPGKGFFVRNFTGTSVQDTELPGVELKDGVLVVSAEKAAFPRFTFDVTRRGRYLALKLKRVEGLPAASLASLQFEMNCIGGVVKVLPLDHMTQAYMHGPNQVLAGFNHLWHRTPGDPLGGFALYVAASDEEEDDALLDIWCGEDLPRPALAEPWTKERARKWVDDYYEQFKDMTTMIIGAESEAELYRLTDLAAQKGVRMVYLHTDTWRGEYWPVERSHVHVNEAVFPKGRSDLKRYSEYLAKRGMNLALHYCCAGIGPKDPTRIAGHVERNLAGWCRGALVEAVDKEAREIRFRPEAGSDLPFAAGIFGYGPGQRCHIMETCYMRIEDEIIRVGQFVDTDKPVWILRGCRRAHGATVAAAHAAGAEAAGLLSAYGQNFVPDADSPLLAEMAGEYAAFANEIGLDQLEYDAYEIHTQYPWGPRKFSDLVARRLDHPVVSNTSGGAPVASNLEMKFSKIRKLGQFGYHTVNLSFQLDGHRPATSILDNWFELSSLVAKGVKRFQVLKPEPMFGVTGGIVDSHGLVDEGFAAFQLWREVLPLLTGEQLKELRGKFTPFGNHMQGRDLYQVRKLPDRYELVPTRVMVRREGDAPWKVGQEFGPVGPRQFCQPGQSLELENPFEAQPAGFVIRVLSEFGESRTGQAVVAASGRAEAIIDSYRTGADAAGKEVLAGSTQALALATVIQPKAAEIHNQRFARFEQDGDALVMTAENPRGEPLRIEENLPGWRKDFSMAAGRGVALEIEGDGSGSVVLLQLNGRGTRDYVVKVDFKDRRTVVIPGGEVSWADGSWGWRMGAKHFDYGRVHGANLGFGHIPPRTSPRVRIANLRVLADVPSKLVNPVIVTGAGRLTVQGEVGTGCYLRFDGGEVAAVHDRNWKKLGELKVTKENYLMPAGFAPVRVEVAAGTPRPWLELQTVVTGKPMLVTGR